MIVGLGCKPVWFDWKMCWIRFLFLKGCVESSESQMFQIPCCSLWLSWINLCTFGNETWIFKIPLCSFYIVFNVSDSVLFQIKVVKLLSLALAKLRAIFWYLKYIYKFQCDLTELQPISNRIRPETKPVATLTCLPFDTYYRGLYSAS